MKFAAFDLETTKIIPENATNIKQYMPLGISCAALAYSDREDVAVWQGVPQLEKAACQEIVRTLLGVIHSGYTLLTWNGCGFDFAVLAVESGLIEECSYLALEHVDLMLLVTFTKGHFLGLDKALAGAGLGGKVKTVRLSDGTALTEMSGAKVPFLWARGEYQAVLGYLRADVVQLLALAKILDIYGRIEWTSNSGNRQSVSVKGLVPVKACFEFPEPDVSWMNNPPSREGFVDWIPDWRQRLVKSLSSNSSTSSGTTVTLELLDDGTIIFRDNRGDPLSHELVLQLLRERKRFILLWLQTNCDEHNQRTEAILHLHTTTPRPDTVITFTPAEFGLSAPVAPTKSFSVPYPQPPSMKDHNFVTKRIGFLGRRIDEQNDHIRSDYENEIKEWERARAESERDYEVKQAEYMAQIAEYERQKTGHRLQQERRKRLIEEERLTDTAAMTEFLAETLHAIVWPAKTTVDADIRDEGRSVFLAVNLPEIDDLPKLHASVNKRDLKLTYRERSKVQRLQDYVIHIHAIGFRVLGEVFVSLPTVSTVVLSAYSQQFDDTTGHAIRQCLYSARVARSRWSQIDFSNLNAIDVVKSFDEFELRRKMTKSGKLSAVEPFSS